jgi:hypothetical protein
MERSSNGPRFDPVHSAAASGAAIIDPSTNAPGCTVVGATLRAAWCMRADSLTKVVMIQAEGAGPLRELYRASALMVTADDVIRITPDRPRRRVLCASILIHTSAGRSMGHLRRLFLWRISTQGHGECRALCRKAPPAC